MTPKKNNINMKYELVNFCEFDKYAEQSYCAIHGVDKSLNLGDITKVDENNIKSFNMICGGSPCFPAGTKILTKIGLVNIEDIKQGDYVYTHYHRYMSVNRIGGEHNKEIYRIKAQGFLDIFTTSYHPFYVKRNKNSQPEKVKLKDIEKGNYIGSPINLNSFDNIYLTKELCWILGRYVADGHIRKEKRKNRNNSFQYGVILSIGNDKLQDVKNNILTYNYSCYPHSQSTHRVVINSAELVEIIETLNFGTSALTKTIPQDILDLPVDKLKSFLDGYMSGDGCEIKDSGLYSATTISENLAITLCQAIQKVYRVGCRIYHTKTPDTTEIEGRIVNQNDTYIVRFIPNANRKHLWFIENDIVWYPVKLIESTGRFEDVYNIEVDTDHTYIANNAIVFNCQDFSVAGGQAGSKWKCKDCGHEYNPLTVHYSARHQCPNCGGEDLDKSRSSLLVEWLRVIRANKPKWGIYENVKNIVSKKFQDTFNMFINELHEYGYNTYYKVLNSKDFGVPQSRERVFLIIILKEYDNGQFKFPEGFDNGKRLKDVLEAEVDEKYYINTPEAQELIDDLISSGKLKKRTNKIVQLGNLRKDNKGFTNPQTGRVYSKNGIAPTINTCQGGDREPKVLEKTTAFCPAQKATKSGVKTNNSNTGYRIRKFTPKECWRLMGFSDDNFERARKALNERFYKGKDKSSSQLYKQAGNSIVTDVLYYVFKELYVAMPYLFEDLKVSSYFSGIGAFEIALDRLYDTLNSGSVPSSRIDTSDVCNTHRERHFVIYDDYNSRIRADQTTIGTLTSTVGHSALRNSYKLIEEQLA